MKILDLSLTYHWYDEIESGRKKEEYRDIKPFYRKRIMNKYHKDNVICNDRNCDICAFRMGRYPFCTPIHYDIVRFHRGQGSKTTMLFEIEDIRVGFGRIKWGAPKDKKVFIIKLGKQLK